MTAFLSARIQQHIHWQLLQMLDKISMIQDFIKCPPWKMNFYKETENTKTRDKRDGWSSAVAENGELWSTTQLEDV